MVQYLLDSGELEQHLEALIKDHQGTCFPTEVTNALQRMVDSYNHSQSTEVLDSLIGQGKQRLGDYSGAEFIVDQFVSLVESCVDRKTHGVSLEYHPKDEVLVAIPKPNPLPDPVKHLKEEYQHATSQGDFYPERMRRAFNELGAYL